MKQLDKTHQMPNRTWVIPKDQVDEFMNGPINYKQLIEDCLKDPKADDEKKLSQGVNKKKSFWNKEITFNF